MNFCINPESLEKAEEACLVPLADSDADLLQDLSCVLVALLDFSQHVDGGVISVADVRALLDEDEGGDQITDEFAEALVAAFAAYHAAETARMALLSFHPMDAVIYKDRTGQLSARVSVGDRQARINLDKVPHVRDFFYAMQETLTSDAQ
jgi:hypothetical protein